MQETLNRTDDLSVLGILLAALKTSGADYLITGDKDMRLRVPSKVSRSIACRNALLIKAW
jgi:hypothetical protein